MQTLDTEDKMLDSENSREKTLHSQQLKSPKRYLMVVLLFFGFINMHILRSNLNIAIVEMRSNKMIALNNTTVTQKPEFNWNSKQEALLLSSFYYGFLFSLYGGSLSSKYGGVSMFGLGSLITIVLTILAPIILRINFYLFIFSRVLEGIAEALSYTSSANIWSRWAAPDERSKLMSYSFCGVNVGQLIAYPLCGYIGHTYGWPAIFYGTGFIGLGWLTIWLIFARNDPPSSKSLLPNGSIRVKRPPNAPFHVWKNMFTSGPLWALSAAKIAYAFSNTILHQNFPIYIKDNIDVDTGKIGLISTIPNIFSIISVPLNGYLIDLIINKNLLTPSQAHKLFMSGGLILTGVLLLAATIFSNFVAVICYFTISNICISFVFVIIQLVPLYMAPKYSSQLCGFTAFWYTIMRIFCPNLIGFIDPVQWSTCFMIIAIIHSVVAIMYITFSSSELQPWAKKTDRDGEIDLSNK